VPEPEPEPEPKEGFGCGDGQGVIVHGFRPRAVITQAKINWLRLGYRYTYRLPSPALTLEPEPMPEPDVAVVSVVFAVLTTVAVEVLQAHAVQFMPNLSSRIAQS